ncbi:hypothetical protein F3Y22_tig00112293pilonHSYRG00382 [Hibiscus syriacus]|uniref:Major facilitator superfamily (MFS) profile domain-containing protein n=1 Tax=Hibiscus syriacus TaxID=106335 RepID=A0A6A2XFU1_HIBSY|nr:hypothetical protein F3Y22_tig00112293pilonHSYRG00382 [Hibiscus syriacus]
MYSTELEFLTSRNELLEKLGLSYAHEVFNVWFHLTIGAMLVAVTSGRIADMIGRKGGALSLDAGRFSTGYGIGVFSYVVPIFIAEIAPKNIRGGLTTLNQVRAR